MGAGHQVIEVEDKYEVPDGFELPDLGGLAGVASMDEAGTAELEAIYYDTEDLRLARSRITMRRRTGGGDAGWHVKLPAEIGRREIQRPLGRGRAVPVEFRRLVLGRTRGAALIPVARLHTARTTRTLRDAEGTALADVMDDRVHGEELDTAGDIVKSIDWRELEVELVEGGAVLLAEAGKQLQSAGAWPSERPSKVATVLGERLDRLAGAAGATSSSAGPATPAGEVVRAYLAVQLEKMLTAELQVRLDEGDGIHDMRVATRRLRSTLRSFEALTDAVRAVDLEDRLKTLAGELGVVRDAEVLLDRLLAEIDRQPVELVLGPVRDRLREALSARMLQGRETLLRVLDAAAYAKLVDDLHAFLADGVDLAGPGAAKARKVLPRMVSRRYRTMAQRAERATGSEGAQRALALHETRKAAKKVRYAAEAVADAFGAEATAFAAQAERVQEVLGEHQDSVVAAQQLRELAIAAHARGESSFTYGLLAGIEEARGAAARDTFDEVWSEVSRKRYRRWLK